MAPDGDDPRSPASGRFIGRIGPWRPEGWPGLEVAWTLAPVASIRVAERLGERFGRTVPMFGTDVALYAIDRARFHQGRPG